MRALGARSLNAVAVAVLGLACCLATARIGAYPQSSPTAGSGAGSDVGSEIVLVLDPGQSKIHWIVDSSLHTVHGTFALKSGAVHFNLETGKAGGEIVVSAASGESGNGSRDERMQKEILESAKYPDAVFRPIRVEGKVGLSGASDVRLSGVFSIHGADHEVTVQVHAELSGERWHGEAKFEVPYVQWGIKDPSNFLLKVKPVVEVEVEMAGAVDRRR
jgi:polyisoprenoid-binding protein YceI